MSDAAKLLFVVTREENKTLPLMNTD